MAVENRLKDVEVGLDTLTSRVGRLEDSVIDCAKEVGSLANKRITDRESARKDNERRHGELTGLLRELNGTVLENKSSIRDLNTRDEERLRMSGQQGVVNLTQGKAAMAAKVGGGLGVGGGFLWLVYQVVQDAVSQGLDKIPLP